MKRYRYEISSELVYITILFIAFICYLPLIEYILASIFLELIFILIEVNYYFDIKIVEDKIQINYIQSFKKKYVEFDVRDIEIETLPYIPRDILRFGIIYKGNLSVKLRVASLQKLNKFIENVNFLKETSSSLDSTIPF